MDKIVFDIETKNSFDDVGGREYLERLEVSVVGVYSYNHNTYQCFTEHELDKLGELFKKTSMLVGFSSKRFDIPVLKKYFSWNIGAIPHFDILEEIEGKLGRRVSLDALAQANVGEKKTSHGLEAIAMYRRGEIERLKEYCLQDVKLTKDIFDLIRAQGYVWIPDRFMPQMTKCVVSYTEVASAAQAHLL